MASRKRRKRRRRARKRKQRRRRREDRRRSEATRAASAERSRPPERSRSRPPTLPLPAAPSAATRRLARGLAAGSLVWIAALLASLSFSLSAPAAVALMFGGAALGVGCLAAGRAARHTGIFLLGLATMIVLPFAAPLLQLDGFWPDSSPSRGFLLAGVAAPLLLLVAAPWLLSRLRPLAGHARLRQLVRRLCDQLDGDYEVDYPLVRMRLPTRQLCVTPLDYDPHAQAVLLEVAAPWFDRQFRMELFPAGWFSRLKSLVGMKDVQAGDDGFDRAFLIASNDPRRCRSLLSGGVRRRLQEFRLRHPQFATAVSGGRLRITGRMQPDCEGLRPFVDQALAVHAAMLDSDQPVQFADEPPAAAARVRAPEIPFYVCQVCGEQIREQSAECRRCRTPHHEECWQYLGGCSTYACFGQEYLRRGAPRERESAMQQGEELESELAEEKERG